MTGLKASVVIPTYKRGGLALECARHIRKFDRDIEIIVIDQENDKQPDPKTLKKLNIKYLNLPKANSSVAKNTGLEKAHGKVVIFFDDDAEVTEKTIQTHVDAYADPLVVGVAGRVINDHEPVPQNTNAETGKSNILGTRFDYRFWSTRKQTVDFVYGCNMSFRKDVLLKIGGFDQKFPKIFEEVDLSNRIKKFGEIVFLPDALVYHHKAKAGGIRHEEELDKQRFIFSNYGRYIAKNVVFPLSLISFILRLRTAYAISGTVASAFANNYYETIKEKLS